MNQLDLYYRAFLELRKQTAADRESARHRNIIAHDNSDGDILETVRYFCTIKEDWISAIESGLVFVEKAIMEERQFIRNDGEVVPIEKAKHVDKHSVEHLAKHSEFISRLPEDGEEIVPDKLYMLERDSDYAVYENRFLYMLLRYLYEFIDMRLGKIQELGNTYRGMAHMEKNVSIGKRHIIYRATLEEDRRNDEYSFLDDGTLTQINRIEAIAHWVNALLATPLMEQVAKVPMVRPPITKTNVLRMNNNFKNAVALYEFVASYEGDGYVIEEKRKKISPFPDSVADEFSELVLLTSFLTYEYGNDVKDVLKASYDEEEVRRRNEESEKLAAQIGALKKRIAELGESPETYMLLLEKRNKSLEADSRMLKVKTEENKALVDRIHRLEGDVSDARMRISKLDAAVSEKLLEIESLNQKYETDIAALRAEHDAEMTALNTAHAQEITSIKTAHTEAVAELERSCAESVEAAKKDFEEKLGKSISENNAATEKLRSELAERSAQIEKDADARVAEYGAENDRLVKESTLARAELNAMRQQYGLTADIDDFSSKERFEELEREYAAFVKLFEREWRKTKKRIRKEILWTVEDERKDKSEK